MTSLLDLPDELKEEILVHLDYRSILICSTCCKSLAALISGSPSLRYAVALGLNSMTDSGSGQSHSELHFKLLNQRTAWDQLDWNQPTTVHIDGECYSYELVAGTFAKAGQSDLTVVWLPSSSKGEVSFLKRDVGLAVRDFALDPTQDLVILLEDDMNAVAWNQSREVRLHIRTLSTNQVHPEAIQPFVHFRILPDAFSPNTMDVAQIQLANDLLSLFMWKAGTGFGPRGLVWNWKQGHLLYDSNAGNPLGLPNSIDSFSLIGADAFIFTSRDGSGLIHVHTFPDDPTKPAKYVVSLRFPSIHPPYRVSALSVHSAPYQANPIPGSLFSTSPDSRIHCFSISYELHEGTAEAFKYNLFIHNKSFRAFVEKYKKGERWGGVVDWNVWGPQNCRYIPHRVPHWLRYTHGHRVVCKSSPMEGIEVLDFSPVPEVSLSPCPSPSTRRIVKRDNPSVVSNPQLFQHDVITYLPYATSTRFMSQAYFSYMIDEARIIGVKPINNIRNELHVYSF